MPTHMTCFFTKSELASATLAEPFRFTKGCPVLRMRAEGLFKDREFLRYSPWRTELFDLRNDPRQEQPITDRAIEERLIGQMVKLMKENDAPPEQFVRLGLPA